MPYQVRELTDQHEIFRLRTQRDALREQNAVLKELAEDLLIQAKLYDEHDPTIRSLAARLAAIGQNAQ